MQKKKTLKDLVELVESKNIPLDSVELWIEGINFSTGNLSDLDLDIYPVHSMYFFEPDNDTIKDNKENIVLVMSNLYSDL